MPLLRLGYTQRERFTDSIVRPTSMRSSWAYSHAKSSWKEPASRLDSSTGWRRCAARIAGRASAGEVLVSERVAASTNSARVRFQEIGSVELKGLLHPVPIHRARRAR